METLYNHTEKQYTRVKNLSKCWGRGMGSDGFNLKQTSLSERGPSPLSSWYSTLSSQQTFRIPSIPLPRHLYDIQWTFNLFYQNILMQITNLKIHPIKGYLSKSGGLVQKLRCMQCIACSQLGFNTQQHLASPKSPGRPLEPPRTARCSSGIAGPKQHCIFRPLQGTTDPVGQVHRKWPLGPQRTVWVPPSPAWARLYFLSFWMLLFWKCHIHGVKYLVFVKDSLH